MRQQSPQYFTNSLNSSKIQIQDKGSLRSVKLPESKPVSNKDIFLQQVTPRLQSFEHIPQDPTIKNENYPRQNGSKNRIDSQMTSQKESKSASIKDLLTDPNKQTIEARDQRNNYFNSDPNIKIQDNTEKNIRNIIEERYQPFCQEVQQGTGQQLKQIQEKAEFYSKQIDSIDKDMQASKNELKRLLNFEQYLKNTVEQIGSMQKNSIEQIVQKSIENQMQQHIKNSQQFVEDMNKYKVQFDEILKGQLAYVQEAHKKYILDDKDNKQFQSRFNEEFQALQKQIASNYLAMFEKLTNYAQQVEEKALNQESKYMNQLRTIRDELSKQIDDGMKDFKNHISQSEQQMNQKVDIEQFKTLLDEQIQEAKEIFEKISGRNDFAKFSDDKVKELTEKLERDMKKQQEQQITLMNQQAQMIDELKQKLADSQKQFRVTDNQVQRMFKTSGRSQSIQDTLQGQQLVENTQQVKDKYDKILQKSQQVFKEMDKKIQNLQQENEELKKRIDGNNGQKQGKKIRIKPSALKEEFINQQKEQKRSKQNSRSPSDQVQRNQQNNRKYSDDTSPQFKKNNYIFSNQGTISPIASIRGSEIEIPFQTQENLSIPLFPVSGGEVLNLRQSQNEKKSGKSIIGTVKFEQITEEDLSPLAQPLVSPYLKNQDTSKKLQTQMQYDAQNRQKTEGDSDNLKRSKNLFSSSAVQYEIQEIPDLQDEVIKKELELEDQDQERRKSQYKLFDTKQPTHQFQLFDEKKRNSQPLFEENKRNSQSPSLRSSQNTHAIPTQQVMVSSQNNNASIITFNPLNNSQTLPTQQIIQTNTHQFLNPNQPLQTIPLFGQPNDQLIQQNNPQNFISNQPQIQYQNFQSTPKRNQSPINIISPEQLNFNTQTNQQPSDEDKVMFLISKPTPNQLQSPSIPKIQQQQQVVPQQQIQFVAVNQNPAQYFPQNQPIQYSPIFKSNDNPDKYNSKQPQDNTIELENQQKQLLEEREELLNQQQEIMKQLHTIEKQQTYNRQQRAKSTDIVTNLENTQPEQQIDQYFSLNPQYQLQTSQNNLQSIPIQNQLSQSNNTNKPINQMIKPQNDSNIEVEEIIQTLENTTSPKNNNMQSPLEARNLFPLQSQEQKDHLQNLQQLSINPYQFNSSSKITQKIEEQQQAPQENHQNGQQLQNKQFVNRNQLPAAQFFSNPTQKQVILANKVHSDNNQNSQSKQKQQNAPLFGSTKYELFSSNQKLQNQNSQLSQVQSMNQLQQNRRNMVSPTNQESQQSDLFTFKPSQSHQSLGSNQRIIESQRQKQQYKSQTPITPSHNIIQLNDLEDFNEDEIMMYSPTNQKPTYNQRRHLYQSDNDSNFDDDIFFYPDANSATSKKLASPISPINFSNNNSSKKRYIFKQRTNQKDILNSSIQQNNNQQQKQQQPTPPKKMTIEDEQIYEKLIKRRLLYNNKTENTKDKKLKVRKEYDGKLKDIYNKFIYDEKGNPILFSAAAVTFLVNSNLIELF